MGAVLGFIEGIIVIGLALFIIVQLNVSPAVDQKIKESSTARYFTTTSEILKPLLPSTIKKAQDIYQKTDPYNLIEAENLKAHKELIDEYAN